MTRETIWACGTHQAEVEAKLRANNGNGGTGRV
jgi:hypothetical protein